MNEPFGRQPQPITVTLEGDAEDVLPWLHRLRHAAEYKGDMTQDTGPKQFKIYPRAVND